MINKFEGKNFFLSNFYPVSINIKINGLWFTCPTVEHVFQASKTINTEEQREIACAPTPGKAKQLGRKVALRYDWEDIKVDVMRQLIMQKFADADLRQQLLNTNDEELIEGNWWHDNFWGDCYCDKCAGITGKNILGELLMDERKRIRKLNEGD